MGQIKDAPKTVPFRREGNIPVTFVDCEIADPRYIKAGDFPDAFDVCLKVKAKDSDECDWWFGECSNRVITKGNNAGRTQFQMTLETLKKLGIDGDLSGIFKLMGKDSVAWIKKSESNGKDYYNVASPVSGEFEPKGIKMDVVKQRMAALMNPQQATFQQPKQTASFSQPTDDAPNPFA